MKEIIFTISYFALLVFIGLVVWQSFLNNVLCIKLKEVYDKYNYSKEMSFKEFKKETNSKYHVHLSHKFLSEEEQKKCKELNIKIDKFYKFDIKRLNIFERFFVKAIEQKTLLHFISDLLFLISISILMWEFMMTMLDDNYLYLNTKAVTLIMISLTTFFSILLPNLVLVSSSINYNNIHTNVFIGVKIQLKETENEYQKMLNMRLEELYDPHMEVAD